jgi:hypothetical protein
MGVEKVATVQEIVSGRIDFLNLIFHVAVLYWLALSQIEC